MIGMNTCESIFAVISSSFPKGRIKHIFWQKKSRQQSTLNNTFSYGNSLVFDFPHPTLVSRKENTSWKAKNCSMGWITPRVALFGGFNIKHCGPCSHICYFSQEVSWVHLGVIYLSLLQMSWFRLAKLRYAGFHFKEFPEESWWLRTED